MKTFAGKNEQGFTLIEVMIAITVFAIGILAVVSMQVTSLKGNAHSRRMTEGGHIALGKLEELAGLPYNKVVSSSENRDGYALTWTVTEDNPLSNTKKIDIVVQWSEKGVSKRVVLTSYKPDTI